MNEEVQPLAEGQVRSIARRMDGAIIRQVWDLGGLPIEKAQENIVAVSPSLNPVLVRIK
jgi:hypothetical protein